MGSSRRRAEASLRLHVEVPSRRATYARRRACARAPTHLYIQRRHSLRQNARHWYVLYRGCVALDAVAVRPALGAEVGVRTRGVLVGLLLLIMCAAALLYRTLLGPADQLNPDLGVGSFEREARGLLYSSQANIYGRYALALIGSSIVGFTVAYANVSHSAAKAFSTGPSADPIPWLYFTVTLAKTFSASGPSPTSDLAKLLVIAQIGCPPGRVSAHLQPAWL